MYPARLQVCVGQHRSKKAFCYRNKPTCQQTRRLSKHRNIPKGAHHFAAMAHLSCHGPTPRRPCLQVQRKTCLYYRHIMMLISHHRLPTSTFLILLHRHLKRRMLSQDYNAEETWNGGHRDGFPPTRYKNTLVLPQTECQLYPQPKTRLFPIEGKRFANPCLLFGREAHSSNRGRGPYVTAIFHQAEAAQFVHLKGYLRRGKRPLSCPWRLFPR